MPWYHGRRPALAGMRPPSGVHPGLWIARYLEVQTLAKSRRPAGYDEQAATQAKGRLIDQIADKALPPDYAQAYRSWKNGLKEDGSRIAFVEAEALGRVLVGAGQKGPAEFGITLHHTWGVPVLPGSSLKGIAAAAAHQFLGDPNDSRAWDRRADHAGTRDGGPNAYDALFGDVEEQGAVIFHDAWLVPRADSKNGLVRDVLTVHHPAYYQQPEGTLSDTENPTPVAFVSARGSFLVALELHPSLDPATHAHWLQAAWMALREGLAHLGVGSKTNAGYGRVDLPGLEDSSYGEARRAAEDARRLREEQERLAADAAREAADRAARAAQRAQMPSATARIKSLASVEGGADPWYLVKWLQADEDPGEPGVARDEAHVRAAFSAIDAAKRDGVRERAPAALQPWLVVDAPEGFGDEELAGQYREVPDRILKKEKKLREYCDKLVKELCKGGYSQDSVQHGLVLLEQHGDDKHIERVRKFYKLNDDG